MSRPNLAELLAESARNVEKERADKKQVDRITEAVKARLAHKNRAEADDDDLVCPSCGYKAPESEFEPDGDSDSDGFRTDDVTGESGHDDPDNEGDRPAKLRQQGRGTKSEVCQSTPNRGRPDSD